MLNSAIDPIEIAFHPPPSKPASYRRGDLIADGITEQGWVVSECLDLGLHRFLNVGCLLTVNQIANKLFRREANHDPPAVARRGIQKRTWCGSVRDSDGVEA